MPDLRPIFDRRSGVVPREIARMSGHAGHVTWRPLKGDGAALREDAEHWYGVGEKAERGVSADTGLPVDSVRNLFARNAGSDGLGDRIPAAQLDVGNNVTPETVEMMFAGLAAHADYKRAAKAAARQ